MERLKLGQWLIEIDRAKTLEFYRKYHLITEDCSCSNCRNYVKACEDFPAKVLEFFDSLGIIPTKEAEVYECYQNEDRTYLYGGFYHIVGQIIEGPDYWVIEEDTKGKTPRHTRSASASTKLRGRGECPTLSGIIDFVKESGILATL